MRCPNCNGEVSENEKFCRHCGANLTRRQQKAPGIFRPLIMVPTIVTILSVTVILLCVFVFPVPEEKSTQERVQAQLDLGNQYVEEANYDAAVVAFNEALEIDEKSAEAELGLAEAYTGQGDREKALEALNRVNDQQLNPSSPSYPQFTRLLDVNDAQVVIVDQEQGVTGVVPRTPGVPNVTATPTPALVVEWEDEIPAPEPEEDPEVAEVGEGEIAEPTQEPEEEAGLPEISGIPEPTEFVYNPEEEQDPYAAPVGESEDTEEELWEEGFEEEFPEEYPEEAGDEMAERLPEEILTEYMDTTLFAVDLSPVMVAAGSENSLTRGLSNEIVDFYSDGSPELVAFSMNQGGLRFEIYKAENDTTVLKGSGEVTTGFGNTLSDYTYVGTQECFTYENYIGLLVYYENRDKGGMPSVYTEMNLYQVQTDGTVSQVLNRVVCENGQDVDSFVSQLNAYGLSGSWLYGPAGQLEGLGLEENPEQDLSVVENPIALGLSFKESVTDWMRVDAGMPAGSGQMNISFVP